ncbi:MAG: chorismate synthase [Clostridia bacterium]|nr:chorismate synthase [Clostridia bacterium]
MSKWKGDRLSIEIFGQSHAKSVGANVENFPKIKVDFERLEKFMARRRGNPKFAWSTPRIEGDVPTFSAISDGVLQGDFTIEIANNNVKSKDYSELFAKPRPSHADYVRYLLDGTCDFSGGGEYSARLTAPFAVVGALAKQYLEDNYGIKVLAYLSSVGNVLGKSYKDSQITDKEIESMGVFPALSNGEKMVEEIKSRAIEGDSVGGVVQCIVFNPLSKLGGNLFGGLEGKISNLLYAIPGVKGVEFGEGFDISKGYGSTENDQLFVESGKVKFKTNKAGGINGGVSNGEPITMSVAFRPTPSIFKEQNTVDLQKMENTVIKIKGRHDSCIAVRGVPVVESAVAIAILDSIKE